MAPVTSRARSVPMFSALSLATAISVHAAGAQAGNPETNRPDDPAATAALLRQRLRQLQTTGNLTIDDVPIVSRIALPRLYAANAYRLFWTPDRVDALVGLVRDSARDGLDPADYHLAALAGRPPPAAEDPEIRTNTDLLATDAFVMLLAHLYLGKVDPKSLDPHWNFDLRPIEEHDAVAFMTEAMTKGRLAEAVAEARPRHWWYERARASLAEYRDLAARGGWSPIPPGRALKQGVTDPRVAALRRRLAASRDLVDQSIDSTRFDVPLADAVRAFQERHRLETDGAVGSETLAELNVPVEARIEQIRANLERGRWVLHGIPAGNLVLVDVAGFEVSFLRDREQVWQARIQIGKPYRQTPIFHSKIDHVVFNPTWTVPPGIFQKDILPAVRRDPGYLEKKHLDVVDHRGHRIDSSKIDWSNVTARGFRYMLRQEPGPDNALGRVKIMFPNPYSVYLHDTPSKGLFEKEERAFSSGCIRVERPLELAALLLDDSRKWNADSITRAIEAGKTETVRLRKPVPVLLMYWTIVPSDQGRTVFKRDPYGRDAPLAKALNEPPRAVADRAR